MLLREGWPDHQPLSCGWRDHKGVDCDKMVCIHLHSCYILSLYNASRSKDWEVLTT